MKTALFSAVAAALLAVTFQPAGATTSDSSMNLPKCPHSDSVVGVSTKYRVYATKAQVQAAVPNMTVSQFKAWMAKHNIQLMCKSQAQAMSYTQTTSKNPMAPILGGVGNATDTGGMR